MQNPFLNRGCCRYFVLPLLIICCCTLLLQGGETRRMAKAAAAVPVTPPDPAATPEDLIWGIPGQPDLMLVREGFSLGYSEHYRQALWVSYVLTARKLKNAAVKRKNEFKPDPAVRRHPVQPRDYTRTGYDRGHLAPAADMQFSSAAMAHSFFMTNISPQLPGCNRGIWKRLETQVRLWARQEKQICVITGPLFQQNYRTMGRANLPVPYAFYKVILDMTPPMKMIAFIVPNCSSRKRLPEFVVTVDYVEQLTGCDFFSALPDELENRLEARSDFQAWSTPSSAAALDQHHVKNRAKQNRK